MKLQRFLPVPLLAFALVHPASSTPRVDGSAIVVVPGLVRISGKPVQVGVLPLARNAPYLVSYRASRTGHELPAPEPGDILGATLSLDARWVAYTSGTGVAVCDLTGRVIHKELGATSCAWNPHGRTLAALGGDGIRIWRLGTKTERTEEPAEVAYWGTRDTLFFLREGSTWALDVRRGRISVTSHHGPIVSPDGLYSVDHLVRYWPRFRITHDRTSTDLSLSALAPLGPCAPQHFDEPFWVQGSDHLLCISICGDWRQGDGSMRWGCRTGVVDVMTSELVADWPGNILGVSADGKSVWITDGFDMSPHVLPQRALSASKVSRPRVAKSVRVRVSTMLWSSRIPEPRLVEEHVLDMEVGDIVPLRYPGEGTITLVGIPRAGRAAFRISNRFDIAAPGRPFGRGDSFEVGSEPVRLSQNGDDGGVDFEVALVR